MMDFDKAKVVITTDKFAQLRERLDKNFYYSVGPAGSMHQSGVQIAALKVAMDNLLTLLSECARGEEHETN